jgi:hypothetical protein
MLRMFVGGELFDFSDIPVLGTAYCRLNNIHNHHSDNNNNNNNMYSDEGVYESMDQEYVTYSSDSNVYMNPSSPETPDIIYIEDTIKTESMIENKSITSDTTIDETDNDVKLTIPDLVKSCSRSAKNKAQSKIADVLFDTDKKVGKQKPKTKPIPKPKSAKQSNPILRDRFIGPLPKPVRPVVKRGVRAININYDAELACLGKDAIFLRKYAEALYNYFNEHHIDKGLTIDTYISYVFEVLLTFVKFKMTIRLHTGILVVDFLCDNPFIEVLCKCGAFRKYTSELIK